MSPVENDPKKARDSALRLLSRRHHCRRELERKLQQRRYSEPVVQRVLEDLASRGLIDDESFAKERSLQLRTRRRWGSQRIRTDLAGRGVDANIIGRVLDGIESICPSEEALQSVVSDWVAKHGAPESMARLKKLFDHCRRRGFSSDLIRDQLEPFWSQSKQSSARPGDRRRP